MNPVLTLSPTVCSHQQITPTCHQSGRWMGEGDKNNWSLMFTWTKHKGLQFGFRALSIPGHPHFPIVPVCFIHPAAPFMV